MRETPAPRAPAGRRGALLVSLPVLAAAALPLLGLAREPAGLVWSGMGELNRGDFSSYVSFIEQARDGRWLFRNLMTPEEHPAVFFRPVYLAAGLLARVTGCSGPVAFHLLRLALGAGLLLGVWRVARSSFPEAAERVLGLALVATSAGVGWLVSPRVPGALDLQVPEAWTFGSLYTSPHFTASLGFVLLVVEPLARVAEGRARWRRAGLLAGAGLALLALEHPYDLVTLAAVVGPWIGYLGIRHRARVGPVLAAAALGGLVAAPAAAYQLALTRLVPVYEAWQRQNVLPTPGPAALLAGYGLLLPLAALGLLARPRGSPRASLLALWAFVPLGLAYLPVAFQRRLLESAHMGLALLAAAAVARLGRRLGPRAGTALGALVTLLLLPSSARLVWGDLEALGAAPAYPRFVPRELRDGARWIRSHTGPDRVVLADPFSSNLMAGEAARPMLAAHELQTVDMAAKQAVAAELLCAGTPADGRAVAELLARWRVGAVVVGPATGRFCAWLGRPARGPGDLAGSALLRPAFRSGTLTVLVPAGGPRDGRDAGGL